MRLPSLAVLVLTAFLPLSATAATITVQSGETLSDIAERYNMTVNELMRLNGISNANHVEAGGRLRIPDRRGRTGAMSAGPGRHRVIRGETLIAIAVRYQVSPKDLMAVNGLRNANHVELGQTLKLPKNAVLKPARTKPAPIKVVPGALEHTVGKGQTLTQIAKAYKVPVTTLISINQLEDPNKVKIGTRLYLTAPSGPEGASIESSSMTMTTVQDSASSPTVITPAAKTPKSTAVSKPATTQTVATKAKPSSTSTAQSPKAKPKTVIAKKADWRTYGPLQVDWANWHSMDGSYVVPTLNANGQALYIAINCSARKLNATGANGGWKTWSSPRNGFEKDLMKDRCQAKA